MPKSKIYRFRPRTLVCPHASATGCKQLFSDRSGLTRHVNSAHRRPPSTLPRADDAIAAPARNDLDSAVDGLPPAFAGMNLPDEDEEIARPPQGDAAPSGCTQAGKERVEYHPYLNGAFSHRRPSRYYFTLT